MQIVIEIYERKEASSDKNLNYFKFFVIFNLNVLFDLMLLNQQSLITS